ncbi:MAG TPA: glycosyltransferase family 4 protein [Acidimicrobiia bacterium]|nr:glycosyltransferase family 4 protein [Acidimicrobiia bacterium]
MRVLLVTNDFPPRAGGIQQYLKGLVAAFPGKVRVLAPRHDGAPPDDRVVRGSRRFMWPTRRTRRWVARQVEEFQPDVVLFGAPHPLAHMGPRLRDETGVPYAVLCHGAEITVPAAIPIARQLVRHPLKRADAVLANSRFTAGRVERLTGRPVRVVGVGVDPGFAPGPGPDGVVVGCVSRFVPRKGQRRVLRAVHALRGEGHDVEVLLVGKGRDEGALRRLAERLGVPTRFEVDVAYDRLPGLYREMKIFAMPCRTRWFGLEVEGLGVVFLESAATGLPVVAGDSGGAPETVDPGVTGFVVDTDRTLLDAMRRLVGAPTLAAAMGRAGLEWVGRHYTWEATAARFEAGLREAIGG